MAEKGSENLDKSNADDAVPGREEKILCQSCALRDKQTLSDVFCSTCDEFQCAQCSNLHKTLSFSRSHKLVNAKEVKTKPVSFDMKGLDQCDKHPKVLEFFCEDENQLCCSSCAILDHRKCHSVVEIQKIARSSKSTSSQIRVRLQEVKAKAGLVVTNAKSLKEQLDQDVKELPLKIRRMRDNVMKMFDDLEVTAVKKAESFKTHTLDKLTKKQAHSEKYIADAAKSLETIDKVNLKGTPSQQFILQRKMEKDADQLCSDVDKEYQKLETVTVSFDFDESLKLPPRPMSDYVPGQLSLIYSESEGVTPIAHVAPTVELTEVTSIDLKQTGDDVKEPLYTGLDFLEDGRLVAVDNNNRECLIYIEKLGKVGSHQLSYTPLSVVAVSENEVAIASDKIYFIHVSKSNEISLNRACKVTTKYYSICLKDDRHLVAGTFDDTRPARIVSLSGEENNFRINFTNKKYPLGTSACTYIRNSDKLVFTDMCAHTFYIYDIATNTKVVVKGDQINEPRRVAVGPHCILVCSMRTNSIVQISLSGQIISSHKLDMICPVTVCVSKGKSVLAVKNCCKGKTLLKTFKITNQLIFYFLNDMFVLHNCEKKIRSIRIL